MTTRPKKKKAKAPKRKLSGLYFMRMVHAPGSN